MLRRAEIGEKFSEKTKKATDNTHQWLDTNGRTYRKAYAVDKNGDIYKATLNVADGERGKILYDINKIRRVEGGAVPSIVSERGSLTTSTLSDDIVSQSSKDVNDFSENSEKF